VTLNVDLLSLK